jgi:uncharacterized protein YecT (DUF1311 family)
MKSVLPFTIALAISSLPARADIASDLAVIEAHLTACAEKDMSNAGMKMCSQQAGKEADTLLNKVYQAAVTSLKGSRPGNQAPREDEESLRRLIASERAWINYRDAECPLQGIAMLGGTGESLLISDCYYSLTKSRAKDLYELFRDSAFSKN